jgi:peroxiredoxin
MLSPTSHWQLMRSATALLLLTGLFEFVIAVPAPGADEATLAGVVTSDDGQPVARATVVLVRPGTRLRIADGKIAPDFGPTGNKNLTRATTDSAGHFKLSGVQPPYVIVALHDKGYAEILSDQVTNDFPIRLQPWARIEGQIFIGNKPAANETVMYQGRALQRDSEKIKLPTVRVDDPSALVQLIDSQRTPPDPTDQAAKFADLVRAQQEVQTVLGKLGILPPHFDFGLLSKKADANGKFVFEHVVPGRSSVSRGITTNTGKLIITGTSHELLLDLSWGETAQVVLGGMGRAVVGRFDVPPVDGKQFDWTAQQRVIISSRPAQNLPLGQGTHFDGATDNSGNFRVDDVLPGNYQLFLLLWPADRLVANNIESSEPVGELTFDFTVPELPDGVKYSAEPVDLGALKPKMFGGAVVGDMAPDFKLKALDGSEVTLAELHGKVVVLWFWSAWNQSMERRLPALNDLYSAQKDNSHFVLLGLSVDKLAKPAADYIAEKKFAWRQIQLPEGWENPLCKQYGIREVPAFIVIGSDGKIIERGDWPQSIQKAVDQALAGLSNDR